MGNSVLPATPDSLPESRAVVAPEDRFSVVFRGHAFVEQQVVYDFLVQPPASNQGAPGCLIRHSYEDFQELDTVLSQRHYSLMPELPAATFFENTTSEFIASRAVALTAYLEGVLQLEPLPQSRQLRKFLDIWQPLPARVAAAVAGRSTGQLSVGQRRLPAGVVALILSFEQPILMLRQCSAVCCAMHEASRNPRCWPTLRFRSSHAERWQDGFFALLVSVGSGLQALALDISYSVPRLGISVPGDLTLSSLRQLTLSIWDADTQSLVTELLECVESPLLHQVTLEGCLLTDTVLHALCRAVVMTAGRLARLRLLWAPKGTSLGLVSGISLDESAALALGSLLEAAPNVRELSIGMAEQLHGFGVARSMASLQPPQVRIPNTQPLLANMSALGALRHLTFDFLSDDVLVCLRDLQDRSLHIECAKFTGSKSQVEEPEEALAVLLAKLGDELTDFSLQIEYEAELRPFMQGFLRNRIGALANLWQHRASLRSLSLNWTAFDGDGVQCITENCSQLHTLLLERSEYWTDDVVTTVLENLPQLRHFRLRAATMLTDQALYALCENAHRFVKLELEPSYSMSSFALEQLRTRLNCSQPMHGGNRSLFFGGMLENFDPSVSAVSLMAAVAGVPNPQAAPAGLQNVHSPIATLQVLESEADAEHAGSMPPELPLRGPLYIGW